MTQDTHQKVTNLHRRRHAYLYIRQSTLRQVFENTESTKRQYSLRQRAVALGGPKNALSSSTTTWASQALPRLIGKAFNGW
jgi:hypothetical protein